jgi:hypothetical protein
MVYFFVNGSKGFTQSDIVCRAGDPARWYLNRGGLDCFKLKNSRAMTMTKINNNN